MRFRDSGPNKQRGAVAIITGLAMVVLVGFAGLALDGGRLYVNKTELQNAADSCALAAAFELTGAPIPSDAFGHAENAGKLVGSENSVDFQGDTISAGDIVVEFSPALSGPWLAAGSAGGDSKYVRCTIAEDEISPWFMQVLGFGEQTVAALATATLRPAQTNCAIPVGLCSKGAAEDEDGYGHVIGQWYEDGIYEAGEGQTGSFNWIDFSPPGGGASELSDLFEGEGQCDLSTDSQVGQSGKVQSLEKGWNTRFGLYKGGSSEDTAPPDWTGYAYTYKDDPAAAQSWHAKADAYDDFKSKRADNTPYQGDTLSGLELGNSYKSISAATHAAKGANRRLVTVPIVPCEDWASSQVVDIEAWACMLMLHPVTGPHDTIYMEYLGLSNMPGSPCVTYGLPGDSTAQGPAVPTLVQ